ncbi:MAG: cobyrinic acid a,c-diamide synthase [Herminiimonas sp.]|nr:cobyrinic acid a,c-diamide synthase [Herminiimonas sp.]MDB5853365.1 cobyrinic acid a,c-diamide synthase [Herminiimonas sp.]
MTDAATSIRILLVSAAASGAGKTTFTAALARKLCLAGEKVAVFKVGADFIDPMLLARAIGAPVQSLDLWIVGEEGCRRLLHAAAQVVDVILIEGVMGLYDGTPSTADLARAFDLPVLAVLDASAMAQTAGALAAGLRDYGPVRMAGVAANRVAGEGHAAMVAASLRDIPLLASLSTQPNSLPERQLGLVLPDEVASLDSLLDELAEGLTLYGDAWSALPRTRMAAPPVPPMPEQRLKGLRIAIARDAAFAFLYPANLECLASMGARLTFFSPLNNEPVPESADAVYLPGGYPELHAEALAAASAWQASIRAVHGGGMPVWAECGGMMSVARTLVDIEGKAWRMAGLLPADVSMQRRLAGIGPQSLQLPAFGGGVLRGHSFHYARTDAASDPISFTRRHASGEPGEAVYQHGSLRASWFHPYFPSCPEAAASLFKPAPPDSQDHKAS